MTSSRAVLGCFVLVLASCSSGTEPKNPDVVGSYSATTFTADTSGQTIDVLAAGGSINITLQADGTTTGRLFVPGGGEDGQDLDANLAGTWTQTGATVRFSQSAADTFIRDVTWTVVDRTLRTTYTGGDTRIDVVLTRQ